VLGVEDTEAVTGVTLTTLFDEMDADNSGTVDLDEFLEYFGKDKEPALFSTMSQMQMQMQSPHGSPVARKQSPKKNKRGGGVLVCCASPR
jgi:hypothetical protein